MKTIHRKFLILALLLIPLSFSSSLFAQDNPDNHKKQKDDELLQKKKLKDQRDNLDAQRIAFITNKLGLTPAEAQVFWPLYNEYDAKRRDINKQFRRSEPDVPIEDLTDKQATELADNQLIEGQKMLDLRKEYHSKFKSVLPPKKLLLLYYSEREFQKHLLDRLKEGNGHDPGPGPATGKRKPGR